jgi:hypothetical protein
VRYGHPAPPHFRFDGLQLSATALYCIGTVSNPLMRALPKYADLRVR